MLIPRTATLTLSVCLITLFAGKSYPATFESACFANAVESCYTTIVGKIDENTPVDFEKFLEQNLNTNKVLLNSTGGNLLAGLKLGQIFRDRNISTFVGRAVKNDSINGLWRFLIGECYSSCAYAFLGGSNRFVPEESSLGFHQFFWDPQTTYVNRSAEGAATESQLVSGLIAGYIASMGVDGTLLWAASRAQSDDLYIPNFSELITLKIVTVQGFGRFTLIPVGDGVAARALRRHDDLHRDPYAQVVAYCWGGDPFLYFTSNKNEPVWSELNPNRNAPRQTERAIFGFGEGISAHDMYFDHHGLQLSDSPYLVVKRKEVDATWWADSINADGSKPVTVALSQNLQAALFERRQLYFWLQVSRAFGSYFAFKDLSEGDVKRLRAAFKLCAQTEKPGVSTPIVQLTDPSFDCSKAGSITEQAICNSAEIATLDRTMAQLYAAKRNISATSAKTLLKYQRDWIKRRNACGADIGCLRGRYDEHIGFLTNFSG